MNHRSRSTMSGVLFFVLLVIPPAVGAAEPGPACDLAFQPLSIPTRDGEHLAADVYFCGALGEPRPVILVQTPYNKLYYRTAVFIPPEAGGSIFPIDPHYHYVVLDWRGFYGSSDAAVPGYDRGLDGYDAVEWIAAQPWSDGRVGTWGSSALGYIQFQTARHHPPHLVCCVPRVKDFRTNYSDFYYGGDYRKEHVESVAALGLTDPDLILAHPRYDLFWRLLEDGSGDAGVFEVPMLIIGGWFDHFPDSVLRAFEDLQSASAPAVRDSHRLLFGPWTHGAVGRAEQGALSYPNAEAVDEDTTLRFWDFHLRGLDNGWEDAPVASFYQPGDDAWVSSASWAGRERASSVYHLHPGGGLAREAPLPGSVPAEFTYDPADPTPALGGSRFDPFDPDVLTGPQDLAPVVETRSDVLVYSTPVLDKPLRLNGPVTAELYISSDRPDTDFCVRLTDVHPDGRSLITTQGIRRARFRESESTETLMTPGQVYLVQVELQELALTILPGHRLRIVVCSADYPHFDLNPNSGGALYQPGPLYPARNRVWQDPVHPSRLVLSVPAPGDVDYDGQISAADLTWLTAFMAENTPTLPAGGGGDMDGCGRVGPVDLVLLSRALVSPKFE